MTSTTWRVEVYDGTQDSARHAYVVRTYACEREARRAAAELLGHRSLRGASTWDRYQGGTVYQFGSRDEANVCDYAVLSSEEP